MADPHSGPSTELRAFITSSKALPFSRRLARQVAFSRLLPRAPATELCFHAPPSGLCFQAPLFELSPTKLCLRVWLVFPDSIPLRTLSCSNRLSISSFLCFPHEPPSRSRGACCLRLLLLLCVRRYSSVGLLVTFRANTLRWLSSCAG